MSLAQELAAAIEEGLKEGNDEHAAAKRAASERERANQDALTNANDTVTSSGLRGALKALDKQSGGRLRVTFGEQVDRLLISTNIPVAGDGDKLTIIVNGDGKMTAYGDRGRNSETITTQGDARPIVKLVAKKAAARGLIPQ